MELGLSDTTLPVKQLMDVNIAWVRQDVGPEDDDLLKSMKANGLKLPILVTTDMIVADGARRLVRAHRLGWKTIPVIVTNDWEVVQNYYYKVNELAEDGEPSLPMTWEETLQLINGPLNALYSRRRAELARLAKSENRKRRAANEPLLEKDRHGFVTAVGQLLGWKVSDLRTIREIVGSIATVSSQDMAERARVAALHGDEAAQKVPDRAAALRKEMRYLEQSGGGLDGGLYTLLRRVRLVAQGHDVSDFKTGPAKRQIGSATYSERKAATIAAASGSTAGRELDAQTIANLTNVIANLGTEAGSYTHVRPSITAVDALEAAKKIRKAVTEINALVRVIRAYAVLLEESSQS